MNLNEYQNYHETKAHTPAEFPYNTYLCSIPLDFQIVPLHWHSEIEIVVIKKGHGLISVDFDKRPVAAGDIVLIRPGQLHSIEQDGTKEMEYENIILKPELLISGDNDLCAEKFILPLLKGEISCASFLTPAFPFYPEAAECISRIDRFCEKRPEGYQLAVKGLLFQFVFLLVSCRQKKSAGPALHAKSLEKIKIVLKYVEENYAGHITIDDMAALTFYSKSHFMKFFKAYMGTGFIEYLNDYRLTIAERLLRTSGSSVLDIAEKSGFDNLSYFNRIFKRKYGQTPGQRRKCHSAPE